MFSIYVTEGEQIYSKQVWSKWGALWNSKLKRVNSEEDLPMWTDCFLPLMYDENHWNAFPFIPALSERW